MARANHEGAATSGSTAKRKLANTLQLFRDLGHSTKDLIAGKTTDEDEDPEYLKVHASNFFFAGPPSISRLLMTRYDQVPPTSAGGGSTS